MDSKILSQKSNTVALFVSTRKGGFIFSSDYTRKKWIISELFFKSWNVMNIAFDPRDRRLHAAVVHDVYGSSTHYSDDLGNSWVQAAQSPQFTYASKSGRPLGTPDEVKQIREIKIKPEEVIKVWKIQPGTTDEPEVLYAGVEPASLFKSSDRGDTWNLNDAIYNHPHRAKWFPGAGGLSLHTILQNPQNPKHMMVAISAGGCYRTDDGGITWNPRNKNVRADYHPDRYPEFGQCVHSVAFHTDHPERLYQQNHCGIYRSDNFGDEWNDIGDGRLPSRFGFPIAVHPHEPDTVYVVLEESDEYRLSIDSQFAVWRTRNGGESWEKLTNGLPERAYLVVLRQAMTMDNLDKVGVYVGTSTGQIFFSRDSGDSWELLADYLPKILALNVVVL
jgi:photosystem II stability/assembly factor-like uncharacterized protein